MKKNLVYLSALILSMGFFYGCNDDGDAKENLLGTWNLKQSDALYIIWESSESITIGGIKMPTARVADLMVEYGSVKLQEELRSITFKSDENIEVDYKSESGGFTKDVYGKYKALSKRDLLYFPDVEKLLKNVDGIGDATINEMKELSKLGIPVKCSLTGSNLSEAYFYFETNTIKEMKILFYVLAASISGDNVEDKIIKTVLEALPAVLDKTSKIEIGLGFYKMNS